MKFDSFSDEVHQAVTAALRPFIGRAMEHRTAWEMTAVVQQELARLARTGLVPPDAELMRAVVVVSPTGVCRVVVAADEEILGMASQFEAEERKGAKVYGR